MKNKKLKLFDPNTSFFNLLIVWGTFFCIMVIALTLIAIANYGSNYQFCGSTECYNNFVTQFKLPLGIISLLIPIGAIFAVQHRSEQSIAQIKVSEGQNNFINYYKHLEEFEKYLTSKSINTKLVINKAHSKIFEKSREGNFDISDNLTNHIKVNFNEIYTKLKYIEEESESALDKNKISRLPFSEIESIFQSLFEHLSVVQTKRVILNLIAKDLASDEVKNKINIFKNKTVLLIDILSFSHSYSIPSTMQAISELSNNLGYDEINGITSLNFKLNDCDIK